VRDSVYKFDCTCGHSGKVVSQDKIKRGHQCPECGKKVTLERVMHITGVVRIDEDDLGTPIDKDMWATMQPQIAFMCQSRR